MNRPSRKISRFDYKGYHRTGVKNSKLDAQYKKLADSLDKDSVMERTRLVDEENIIVREIEGFLEEYDLEDLYSIEDIEKCIEEFKQLKKRFEEVHVKLRRILGEEHERSYKDYDYCENCKMAKITNIVKIAKWQNL